MSKDSPTFNVYVISYNRWQSTIVHKIVEYCTYVVRESQAEKYIQAGCDVLAIEDEKISSFAKVNNYLIENAKEDIICVLDDDIEHFFYRLESVEVIENPVDVSLELERMAQIICDLNIGLMGCPVLAIPYGYTGEINFSSMIGPIRMYNRSLIQKSRYLEMKFFGDTDFVLQELLNNRIVFRPNYLCTDAKLETNSGGMNIYRNKDTQTKLANEMKKKWGKYFCYNPDKNITKILVPR